MKKQHYSPGFRICWCLPAGLIAVSMIAACAGNPSISGKIPDFSVILGKDWRLVEIRTESGSINLDRSLMELDDIGDAFTLRFEEDRINGMALPNRYFGPYTRKGQFVDFEQIASTQMAAFKELDALKEYEYFDYLDRVDSWAWSQGYLELYSSTLDGRRLILIFN